MPDLSLLRARLINVRSFANSQEEYDAELLRLTSEYGFEPIEKNDLGEQDSAVDVMFAAVTCFEEANNLPDWVEEEEGPSGF
jgi:hypothetical protein